MENAEEITLAGHSRAKPGQLGALMGLLTPQID